MRRDVHGAVQQVQEAGQNASMRSAASVQRPLLVHVDGWMRRVAEPVQSDSRLAALCLRPR